MGKKGGKEEFFTVLGGKNMIFEKRGGGNNINYLDIIHPCFKGIRYTSIHITHHPTLQLWPNIASRLTNDI